MALIDFQTALGRMIRDKKDDRALRGLQLDTGEQSLLRNLTKSAGFKFTVEIQRSWCIGRAAKAAYLTLTILPEQERQRLLDAWADSGAGTRSFYNAEAEAFLDFIASRLTDPSHEMTLCQLERATLRANYGAEHFNTLELSALHSPDCLLCQGRYAGLVRFHAEPNQLLNALMENKPLPPVSIDHLTMLFAPGLPQLCRPATTEEVRLFKRLIAPTPPEALQSEGFSPHTFEDLLASGALEYSKDSFPDTMAAKRIRRRVDE